MKLSWESHGAVALAVLSGEFASDGSDELRRSATERLEQGVRSIVVDLANVTIVDGASTIELRVSRA